MDNRVAANLLHTSDARMSVAPQRTCLRGTSLSLVPLHTWWGCFGYARALSVCQVLLFQAIHHAHRGPSDPSVRNSLLIPAETTGSSRSSALRAAIQFSMEVACMTGSVGEPSTPAHTGRTLDSLSCARGLMNLSVRSSLRFVLWCRHGPPLNAGAAFNAVAVI